jgi:segregation and condensation protein A
MPYTVTLPTFEGPLDLLLRLIERAELDVTTIALAQVADQYLAHVRAMEQPDPRALAEFVSMAARLLLIKSRALLPRPASAEPGRAADEDDAETLARQLREYQRFKHAALLLRQWQEEGRRTFLRTAPVAVAAEPQQLLLNHRVGDLVAALERRLQLALPLEQPALMVLAPRLTVQAVAGQIRERLARQAWFDFEDLLATTITRQDLIVTFWAVLELLKRRAINIEQPTLFGPITIGRGSEEVSVETEE